ncbi:MAG: hypothetical protein ACE5GQ_03205 [Nitrospinales bacterium]
MTCSKPEAQEISAKSKTGGKSLLLSALLTAWSLLLSNGPAFAEFFSFPKDGFSPIGAHEIGSNQIGVAINVNNLELMDVLQRIQNESGINFVVHDDLSGEKISARIKAADWTSAALKLLENFSRVEVWDEDGLSSVRLLKSEGYSTTPNPNTDWTIKVKPAGKRTKHVMRGKKYEIFLSEKELLELIKAPSDTPIPAYFIKDLQYRKFLEQFGFESLEDVFDIHNTRTVRLEVRRQLKELKKRNESGK